MYLMETPKNDWYEILKDQFNKPYYLNLIEFLDKEYKAKTIYPPLKDIYKALNLTSYKDTKVVIFGQDPYHEENEAEGLAFSVNENVKIPPSLKNIYKELNNDLNCHIPNNGNLTKWAKQGVLLINDILTVEKHKPLSHKDIGWQLFTNEITKKLNQKNSPVVFILWGNEAIKKEKYLNNSKHLIIKSAHPSPLSANRGFINSKPFSKTNDFLIKNNLKPIDWQIDNI